MCWVEKGDNKPPGKRFWGKKSSDDGVTLRGTPDFRKPVAFQFQRKGKVGEKAVKSGIRDGSVKSG